jgi:hypothetical protein
MAVRDLKSSPLPNPPPEYDPEHIRELIRVLELYFGQLDSFAPNQAESYTADYFYGGAFFASTSATVTGDTTLANTDYFVPVDATTGAVTLTLPPAATSEGQMLNVKKVDITANTVTVDGNSAETIDEATTQVIVAQYDCITMLCSGTEWWII